MKNHIIDATVTARVLLPSGELRDVRILLTPELWQQIGDSRDALETTSPLAEALHAAAVPHLTDEEEAREAADAPESRTAAPATQAGM